jgi:hypothetical protein
MKIILLLLSIITFVVNAAEMLSSFSKAKKLSVPQVCKGHPKFGYLISFYG